MACRVDSSPVRLHSGGTTSSRWKHHSLQPLQRPVHMKKIIFEDEKHSIFICHWSFYLSPKTALQFEVVLLEMFILKVLKVREIIYFVHFVHSDRSVVINGRPFERSFFFGKTHLDVSEICVGVWKRGREGQWRREISMSIDYNGGMNFAHAYECSGQFEKEEQWTKKKSKWAKNDVAPL